MDRPIRGVPTIRPCDACKGSGRMVQRSSGDEKALTIKRRGGNREEQLRIKVLDRESIDKLRLYIGGKNRLIGELKERIIDLYSQNERWKELNSLRSKHSITRQLF